MKMSKHKNYITAFIQVAMTTDLNKNLSDLRDALKSIENNTKILLYLNNPRIVVEDKIKVLKEVANKNKLVVGTISLMLKEKQFKQINKFLEILDQEAQKVSEELTVKVQSVVKLSEKHKQELTKILEKKYNKKIFLQEVIEPTLIAGLKVTVQDLVIDGSVLGKITMLRDKINNLEYKN